MTAQSQFGLENILVKNLSLEIPENIVAPTFGQGSEPTLQMELRNHSRPLSQDNMAEVVLEATVRVKSGDELQLLIEIAQAGIFRVQEEDAEKRQQLLGILAPEILYPYLSQLLSDMMGRAGAPRIFLPPFNFKAVYAKKQEALKQKLEADGGNTPNA